MLTRPFPRNLMNKMTSRWRVHVVHLLSCLLLTVVGPIVSISCAVRILVTSIVPRVWRGRSYDVRRFQLVAYLTTVDPHVADVANDVARTTALHVVADLPTDDKGKTSYLMLYSTIVCCMNNRPPRPIMETVSSDGRETLHKLDAAYRPTYRGTQMALLQQIIHPPLNSANSDAECMGNLSDWHKIVPASPVCVPRKSSQTTIHGRCKLQTTEEVVENTRAS